MKRKVFCGIDNINDYENLFENKKIALITNQTGVNRELKTTIEIINEKYNLVCMLSPEHGVRGFCQAGDKVDFYIDQQTNLPVFSLYGKSPHISESVINSIDIIVFDIQDVGARFYTYLYTLSYAMEDCAKFQKQLIVLDRPNPILKKGTMGSVLNMEFSSFVGKFPLATAYGLTIGEYAKMINQTQQINCNLAVISMKNYSRDLLFSDTDLCFISPSPNLPTIDSCLCYIGTCLFEGTNISEGRGTTKPFETIGATFLNPQQIIKDVKIKGAILRECYFSPTFSKFQNEICKGVQIHITNIDDFNGFEAGLLLLDYIRKNYKEFEFLKADKYFITLLLGSDEILKPDFDAEKFILLENQKREIYSETIKKYYLYN
ncbi:MAG: DUF1343 domain-containing protein [Oscillospiraceae bacterium]